MILKIEVDLTDIYTEYESEASITDLIKDEIAHRIKKDAYEMFSKDAKESFTNQVVRRIELDKELKIQELLKELFSNKKIFKTNYNGEITEMTLEEKISYELERNYNNESKFNDYFRKHFENCTAQISKELKDRYDLLFASQIVAKLNEQGMLKEDVAKILLNK
ncbi:hypothetical protein [Myroides odoratus]|uniref:Uncharacterized protein n=1 Tax=Myroides odoratus TaxID=256 RepID=A0A9Q6Z2P2_MYROD|nr:hypothetical protein [Myroides odoratus]EHQ41501.1 hypothetical protein Myrod_0665 [Myroides odoratus DSM 2801]EKB02706.1 hypothetical protein HMPREF9716_03735 [Myroides odoratus CIP 103059]QQT98927.1 hypothetical protein I6I88_11950 [Myroides odoratus]WQD58888.1 hypothetical protein U0010_07025 [Myroides odoratus]STZ28764.1 Uncharacterised protein [Myroides odoratus]